MPSPDGGAAPGGLDEDARRSWRASATSARAPRPSSARTRRGRPTWRTCSTCSSRRRRCSCASEYARGHPAARADPGGRSLQPGRDAAPGDGALGARTRRARPAAFKRAAEIAPRLAGRAPVPRAALRARARLGARRAAARAGAWPRSPNGCPRSRRWRALRERQGRLAERCAAPADLRAAAADAGELVQLGRAGDGRRRDDAAHRAFERARAPGRRPSRNDLELGVLYLAARRSRTPAPRSTACRRHTPATRWRSSSAPRSACCCSEPDRAARIDAARRGADATTRALIAQRAAVPGVAVSAAEPGARRSCNPSLTLPGTARRSPVGPSRERQSCVRTATETPAAGAAGRRRPRLPNVELCAAGLEVVAVCLSNTL